jgi:hypothetical protein
MEGPPRRAPTSKLCTLQPQLDVPLPLSVLGIVTATATATVRGRGIECISGAAGYDRLDGG